jgi:hypothetical protein
MKNRLSLIACAVICIVLVTFRVAFLDVKGKPIKVTEWDAFGYYIYLPATLIYHDATELRWLTGIDKTYAVTGGNGWQAEKLTNGKYVFKYLGGVALMELPFFAAGHVIAKLTGSPQDGFSPPYQYALAFGIIVYCTLAVLLLRRVLLYYFSDEAVAVTLLMVCLATNFIQYAAVDNAQSHAYLFPLYVLILFTTRSWHLRPRWSTALAIGYIIGLATMTRPTEAIMLFIPLMWDTQDPVCRKEKWQKVANHKSHLYAAVIGGILGIAPQLIYWKTATGDFLYDVGSRWDFLNPHFRVLFGWEKGWFIYTPITVFFLIGMFLLKKASFRNSVLWFCLLNIYIIIAWHEWRYGGSYSPRALIQSYPLFALPMATFVEAAMKWRVKLFAYALFLFLLFVNLFQTVQYNKTILHYDDMNRAYYERIYLNTHPTPFDISMLDTNDFLKNEQRYTLSERFSIDTSISLIVSPNTKGIVCGTEFNLSKEKDSWLKISAEVAAPNSAWMAYLHADITTDKESINRKVRLFAPLIKNDAPNQYGMYVHLPQAATFANVTIYIDRPDTFKGTVEKLQITELSK